LASTDIASLQAGEAIGGIEAGGTVGRALSTHSAGKIVSGKAVDANAGVGAARATGPTQRAYSSR
jgi:hypothetical protein